LAETKKGRLIPIKIISTFIELHSKIAR